MKLSIAQAAYTAGLVDGEGHISIGRSLSRNKRRWEYSAHVGITNTNMLILTWCHRTTRLGSITPKEKREQGWKAAFQWKLRSWEIPNFLLEILPYLVAKRQQAELMLEFLQLSNKRGQRSPTLEQEVLREIIYEELIELNKRGV